MKDREIDPFCSSYYEDAIKADYTPFNQLPALEQAWQLGYQHATSYKANITANPYPADSDESEQWLKGFDNCMDLLYPPED